MTTDMGFLDWLRRRGERLEGQLAVSERVREAAERVIRREAARQQRREQADVARSLRRALGNGDAR